MNHERRVFCGGLLGLALAALMNGCTRTVTKYGSDGKPYTDTETDAAGTALAILLLIGLIAGLSALAKANTKATLQPEVEIDPRQPPPQGGFKFSALRLRRTGDRIEARDDARKYIACVEGRTARETAILRALPEMEEIYISGQRAEEFVRAAPHILAAGGFPKKDVLLAYGRDSWWNDTIIAFKIVNIATTGSG